ncbi:sigma-70 family RNA polymerase sigma factor [Thalassobacillus sp. C254]|uniref:sigma-70 family RNA polymerase sigma factor n=1 Tax=Thalassobacillus sp. C254 TaxID=1225341 RepID=UPI0006CF80E4|nr:sigma-70 family RNA polymerase sigma factor [Thalassobacillus sp. C254]
MEKDKTIESFEVIVDQYTPLLHNMIKRLRIYKNQEEFIHVGKIALWKAYHSFDADKGTFSSLAFSYVRGEMLMLLRKEARFTEKHTVTGEERELDMIDPHSLEPGGEEASIEPYISMLSDREKTWVKAYVIHGYSIREIAAMHGVSSTTVKTWRRNALHKLRERLPKML